MAVTLVNATKVSVAMEKYAMTSTNVPPHHAMLSPLATMKPDHTAAPATLDTQAMVTTVPMIMNATPTHATPMLHA
jgi:hypothetical protein